MVSAGIEGHSKAAIEREWSLHDVDAQRRSWKRMGPPLSVAALHIAAALGVNLLKDSEQQGKPEILEMDQARPTLADLSATVPMPVPGGDTAAASRAVLEKLMELS